MNKPDPYCGQVLNGRYRIEKRMAGGGMGSIYYGTHTLIGRPLAIKILNDKFIGDREMITRFHREARAASAVGHRNIIEIFDMGETPSGNPFLVMEYLEGESLRSLITRIGPLPLGLACGIMEQVLHALSATHDKRIVHRDLKPDNIYLTYQGNGPPIVKLIDFGISKTSDGLLESECISQVGISYGTPSYMPPEQFYFFNQIDFRCDLYSIGVVLYELLAGAPPFEKNQSLKKLVKDIAYGETTPPKENYADFPDEAAPIVMRAISTDPEDRFQSAGQMLESMRRLEAFKQRREQMATLIKPAKGLSCVVGSLGNGLQFVETFIGDADSQIHVEVVGPYSEAQVHDNDAGNETVLESVASKPASFGWRKLTIPGARPIYSFLLALACIFAVLFDIPQRENTMTIHGSDEIAARASTSQSIHSDTRSTADFDDSQKDRPGNLRFSVGQPDFSPTSPNINAQETSTNVENGRKRKPRGREQNANRGKETRFIQGTKGTEFIDKFD